jgi:hypothetical protein
MITITLLVVEIFYGLAPMAMASPQVSMKGNSLYNLVLMANYIFSEILFLLLNAVSSMILKDY